MPICGRTPSFSAASRISPSSVYFLDDRDDVAADLQRQHRRFDELGVLEAVADDGRVVVGERDDRQQLRLGACLEPKSYGLPKLSTSSTTCAAD
jgi:hypothetical protein